MRDSKLELRLGAAVAAGEQLLNTSHNVDNTARQAAPANRRKPKSFPALISPEQDAARRGTSYGTPGCAGARMGCCFCFGWPTTLQAQHLCKRKTLSVPLVFCSRHGGVTVCATTFGKRVGNLK